MSDDRLGTTGEAVTDNIQPGALAFIGGTGEMPQRFRQFDWSASSLGDPLQWSVSLKSYIGLMLSATQPMFMAWGSDRIWFYNDAFTPILGRKHPDALGRPSREVWAEAWGDLKPMFDKVFGGEAVHMEGFTVGLDRRGRVEDAVFDFSYTPIRDDDGSFCGLFGACIETTTRVLAERRTREATERQRRQFEQAPGFICILTGPDHVFEFVNDTHRRLFGSADWVGKPVRIAFPDIAGQGFFELLDQVYATGERVVANDAPVRYRQTPDGEIQERFLDFIYAPIIEADGTVSGIFCEGFDTTEVHHTQERLRTLNAELEQQIVERSTVGGQFWQITTDLLGVLKPDAHFGQVNPAWLTTMGWTEAEVQAMPIFDLLHPDDVDKSMAGFQQLQSGSPVLNFENRYRHKDGSYRWLTWSAVPWGDAYFCNGRDITVLKEQEQALAVAQDALRQAQKMEAVGQLTGGLAHDFNNLLAGISGSLELLEKRLADGRLGGLDRYIGAAQSGARRAAALTQRLLAFSRRQTLDPRPVDVNKLIGGMEDFLRRTVGPSVTLEVVGAGGLWTTRIDPSQLENALLNLCINGRDAMAPDGGRMTIETANKWLDDHAARTRELPPGQYISVCVTDTGTGMTPAVMERAFEPFYTTKPLGQGTGLGLSMIYGFVRQSGGQVRIYTEIGKGTTMCLYLPRHHGEASAEDEDGPPATTDGLEGAGETVLVVDDEETIRMLVVEVLDELGYTSIQAADGPSALKILQSESRIDLLITDVGLPGGLNGRQIADAARQKRADLKILFITGYAENAAVGNGHLDPGMEIVTKPFVLTSLAAKIRDLIEQ